MERLDAFEKQLDDRLAALNRRLDGRMDEIERRVFGNTGVPGGFPIPNAGGMTAVRRNGGQSKGMCRRIGLSVGLDHVDDSVYHGNASPLLGCVTDATDFHAILQSAGFEARLLTEQEASCERVEWAILDAAQRLGAGDLFVMAISGHGARFTMPTDSEPHEFWCLWDGMLPDTRIVDAFSQFAVGTRIVVITDQCHSGGVFLPPNSSEKAIAVPPPLTGRTSEPLSLKRFAGRQRAGGAGLPMLIQFAACRGQQTSLDTEIGGRWITALIKCLAVSRDIGWREWFNRAAGHATVGEVSDRQTPQWVELGPVTEEFRQGRVLE